MPAKSAVGKSSQTSSPSVGTTNQLRTSKVSSGIKLTSESKNLKSSIKKLEDGSPTEIISYADFNRVNDRNGSTLPYGLYYQTLDTLHSVMTDDVKYVIEKSLLNDTTGQWTTLKNSVDASVNDADDLINDMAAVDVAIENSVVAMDVLRLNDEDFQQSAQDYLSLCVRPYERKAENRNITIDTVITQSDGAASSEVYATPGGRIQAFKKVLETIREPLNAPLDIDMLSSKYPKDLNPIDRLDGYEGFWPTILSNDTVYCVNTLSKVFSYSSGIQIVKNDPLAERILFKSTNLLSLFNGSFPQSEITRNIEGSKGDQLPVKTRYLAESAPALSLFQYLNSRSNYTIIPEIESVDKKSNYLSGPDGLVRSSILAGDYQFSEMTSYLQVYDRSMENLSLYVDKMIGMTSPSHGITPSEVFRTILAQFKNGLQLTKDNNDSLYQLLYLSLASKAPDQLMTNNMYHQFLRILSKIQYYIVYQGGLTDAGEDKKPKTTLKTSGENSGKSFSKDAKYTTTQVEDKTKPVIDEADDPRVIKRLSSGSPDRDQLAVLLLAFFRQFPVNDEIQEIRELISEKIEKINEKEKKIEKEKKEKGFGGGNYKESEVKKLEDDIKELKKEVKNLKNKLENYESYSRKETEEAVSNYYSNGMKKTSGTFWSTAVQAYNEIINKATSSLPDGVKMTDESGKTLYGQFEETSLLALIAKIYIDLASIINFKIQRENPSGSYNKVYSEIVEEDGLSDKTRETFLASNRSDRNKPKISIVGYDEENIQTLINEIGEILTEDKAIDELEKNSFQFVNPVFENYQKILKQSEVVQNSMAFLTAYGKGISQSKENLIDAFADIFENVNRRNLLDNQRGRNALFNLTEQQIIYRRALLDKYRPNQAKGYLPERVCYSIQESIAMRDLLRYNTFSNQKSENYRIVAAGLPSRTISSTKYNDPDIGPQIYSGLVELVSFKRDHELSSIIFKENVKLFDPSLFVIPKSFDEYSSNNKSITGDIGLDIGTKINFYLYDRNGREELSYNELIKHERYSSLNDDRKKELVSNTVISYLLETYIYKTTGMIYDEAASLNLSNSVSNAGVSALNAVANLEISDLKLPTQSTISKIIDENGEFMNPLDIGTGDLELILNVASSTTMKSASQVDLLIENSKFDRVFMVFIDPDDFEIDLTETVKINDEFGKAMLSSLSKIDFLENESKLISRDPITGGFSIGDITCQFIPHTMNNEAGAMLNMSKKSNNIKRTNQKFEKNENWRSSYKKWNQTI